MLALLLLGGCKGPEAELDRAMALRAKLLASSVSFDAGIRADYGDEVHSFSVYCEGDSQGNLGFRVTKPETIADITGRIDGGEGKLTFRDTALAFPLLAEDQLSPKQSLDLLSDLAQRLSDQRRYGRGSAAADHRRQL